MASTGLGSRRVWRSALRKWLENTYHFRYSFAHGRLAQQAGLRKLSASVHALYSLASQIGIILNGIYFLRKQSGGGESGGTSLRMKPCKALPWADQGQSTLRRLPY
jgi:hypothetical protein